ncbi:hypothetical protein [Heyndrickxia coagulans]|jgi:hypothetical protein|uniref:Uncharacterized protein n=1 Tax=Heyndrickxia coagulans TaxID=1398 RepID=A0A150KGQ8_HEYCO|nr:hypothetical protein [Heyndrickxia coagulans]KYC71648.1 hypothetical protein B4099_3189 [Heyndrickxia coagulans]
MGSRNNRKSKKRENLIPFKSPPNIGKQVKKIFPKKSQDEVVRLRREKIFFSFRLLDLRHQAFSCTNIESSWFLELLDNLNEISKLTMAEFEQQRNHYDLHMNDFSRTAHNYSESIPEEILEQVSPENIIQFRISQSKGRVHCIRYHNTLYIIWLDPHHNMWPDERYGPPVYGEPPLRNHEILENENKYLLESLQQKEEELQLLYKMIDEDK